MTSTAKKTSQKDYLKQYLRKTKKKKPKSISSRGVNVKLIDDDIEIYQSRQEEVFLEEDEDAPVIAAVIDERPTEVKLMERYRNSNRWKQIEEPEANDRRSLRPSDESPRRKGVSCSKSKQRAGNNLPSSLDSGTERRSKHYRNEVSPVRDNDKHHREDAPINRDVRNDRRDKHSNDLPLREWRKQEDRFRDETSANLHSDRRERYRDKTSPDRDPRFVKHEKRFRELTPTQNVCVEKRDKYYRNEFSPECEPRFDKRYRDEDSAQEDIYSDRRRRYRNEFSPNLAVQPVGRDRHFRDSSSSLRDSFTDKHDKRHRHEPSPNRNARSDRRNRYAADLSTRDLRFRLGSRHREDVSLEQHSYSEKQDKRNREELSPRRHHDRESSVREDFKADKLHKMKSSKFTVKRKRASRSEEKMVSEEHLRDNGSLGYREMKIKEKRDSRGTRANKTKKPRYEEEDREQFYDNQDRGSRHHIEEVREKTPIELRELRQMTDDLDRRLSPRVGRSRYPNDADGYDKRLSPRRERDRYYNNDNFDRRQSPKRVRERFDDEFDKKQSSGRGRERHEDNFDKRMSPRRERERLTDGRNVERRFSPQRIRDRFPSDDFDRRLSPGRGGDRFVDDDFVKRLSPRRGNARHVDNNGSDYDRRMSPRRGHDHLSRDENFISKEFTKKGRDRYFDDVDLERNSSSKTARDKVADDRSLSPKCNRNGRDRHHEDQEKRRSLGKNRQRYSNNDDEKRASPKRTSDKEISYQKSSKAEKNSRATKSEKYGLLDSKKNRSKSKEKIPDELSGKNATTIYRDRKTGKKRDFEAEKLEKIEKRRREEEKKAQYYEWGHGVKQVQDEKEKIKSDLREMSKPLARYADDTDLDRHLRDKEIVGDDPMLGYIHEKRRKKEEKEGKVTKPRYKGSYLPNRFGIPPGYRWDGVDRSNGFENRWFTKQSDKKAREEEAYKWCSADM